VSSTPDLVVRFSASVECRRDASSPLGLTLVGPTAAGDIAHLAFLCTAPAELPSQLEAATVERLGPEQYRISAGERRWLISCARSYLHRDVSAQFQRAVPERAAPLFKRLFWRMVLGAAAHPLGRWWLARRGQE
jgi:hypothetical protein